MTQDNEPWADYIGYDLGGYEYNTKYPPNPNLYGNLHHGGYRTANQRTFFYDVAVHLYGVTFSYNGIKYTIPSDGDDWKLISDGEITSTSYDNPLSLMENEVIDGNKLVDIIDDLKDVDLQ